MSIHITDQTILEAVRRLPERTHPKNRDGFDFAGHLDSAAQQAGEPSSAAAAAELLRLEMMKSAISLCDDELNPSSPSTIDRTKPINDLLQLFRMNAGSETAAPDGPPLAEARTVSPVPTEAPSRQPSSMDGIIRKAADRYGIDEGLIKAVIKAESGFNPNAVSHAGAQGLMQLMPATARGVGVTNPFDPEQNIMGGTKFLKAMLQRYDGDLNSALAAYNWGPGNVDKHPNSLPRETRNYLAKVKSYYAEFAG